MLCSDVITGNEGNLPRCKPFKYTYEKEIVMYAYFKKLDYFSTECIYAPNAYRRVSSFLVVVAISNYTIRNTEDMHVRY